jgi:lipoprotein signal peptidase
MKAASPMKTYRVVLWALALGGLAADQAAKYGVFAWLAPVETHRLWFFRADPTHGFALATSYDPDLEFKGIYVPHVNQGALFGLGRDRGDLANGCFAVISIAAAVAITVWSFRRGAARDLWVCMALGLILAGTLGNLYDRLVFNGVRDFLHWNYLFDWPVFNVADSCLVVGACLLLLQALGRKAAATEKAGSAAAGATAPAAASCVGAASAPKG